MSDGALKGIRVISMGSVWAGPYVGRVLAELDAEVIRIAFFGQATMGPSRSTDVLERWKESMLGRGMTEEEVARAARPVPAFPAAFQCGNYGFGLDLRQEKGKEIYKRLIKVTDVVVDGWSPKVMANLGLDYAILKEIRPELIYASIPALGMTGPDRNVRMFGSGCEALGGADSIRGYADGRPYPSTGHVTDPIAAMFILTSILAALEYRAETGRGQHIDVSQTECGTAILGEAIMDYSLNQRVAKPEGNNHPYFAPHGCYRCRGEDKWITIAITSDQDWQYFCCAINSPEWSTDPKFADMYNRWQHREELDNYVEQWTIQHDPYAIQQMLQQNGICCGVTVSTKEQIEYDPHVKDRNIYHEVTYFDNVTDPIFRVPWVLPRTPTKLDRGSPYTGQHNDFVLRQILGMSEKQIDVLKEKRIVGATPPQG